MFSSITAIKFFVAFSGGAIPQKTKSIDIIMVIAEKRKIIKGRSKLNRIKNTVEELLLGPMSPKINNIFPKDSKLLDLYIEEKKVLNINFNREMLLELEWTSKDGISIYYIVLQSIADTIFYQFRDIEKIKFYFNNIAYRYIGDYGPLENGIKPDWDILKR